MEYLPIIVKVPGKRYKVNINVAYVPHKIYHSFCICVMDETQIFDIGDIFQSFIVTNDRSVEQLIGMKLTDLFIERLKWFLGGKTVIKIEEYQHHVSDNQYTQFGGRTSRNPYTTNPYAEYMPYAEHRRKAEERFEVDKKKWDEFMAKKREEIIQTLEKIQRGKSRDSNNHF